MTQLFRLFNRRCTNKYSDGLHQAIEAKEGLQVQRESQTLATITFQNYFRMYDKLAENSYDQKLPGQIFRLFNRRCTNKHWLPGSVAPFNFTDNRPVLATFRLKNNIRQIFSLDRSIGRNLENFKSVDFNKFLFFCFRRSSHAAIILPGISADIIMHRM